MESESTKIKVLSRSGSELCSFPLHKSTSVSKVIETLRQHLCLPSYVGMVVFHQSLVSFDGTLSLEELFRENKEDTSSGVLTVRLTENTWPKVQDLPSDPTCHECHVTKAYPSMGSCFGGQKVHVYGQNFVDNSCFCRFGRTVVSASYVSDKEIR